MIETCECGSMVAAECGNCSARFCLGCVSSHVCRRKEDTKIDFKHDSWELNWPTVVGIIAGLLVAWVMPVSTAPVFDQAAISLAVAVFSMLGYRAVECEVLYKHRSKFDRFNGHFELAWKSIHGRARGECWLAFPAVLLVGFYISTTALPHETCRPYVDAMMFAFYGCITMRFMQIVMMLERIENLEKKNAPTD